MRIVNRNTLVKSICAIEGIMKDEKPLTLRISELSKLPH